MIVEVLHNWVKAITRFNLPGKHVRDNFISTIHMSNGLLTFLKKRKKERKKVTWCSLCRMHEAKSNVSKWLISSRRPCLYHNKIIIVKTFMNKFVSFDVNRPGVVGSLF